MDPARSTAGAHIHVSNSDFDVRFYESSVSFLPKNGAPRWTWASSHARPGVPQQKPGIVVYDRADVREEYVIGSHSVEQVFVLEESPGTKDVLIAGEVSSDGKFFQEIDGWAWRNESGEVTLGDVFVFDATGQEIPATMEVTKSSTSITIRADDLQSACYPVTIDPEVNTSADFRCSVMGVEGSTAYSGRNPDVAYDFTNNRYIVVWEGSDGDLEIYARLFSADGTPLGAHVAVSNMSGSPTNTFFNAKDPAVVYNSARQEFFVVWSGDDGVDDEFEIYGARLDATTPSLTIEQGEIKISNMGPAGNALFSAKTPDVSYYGGNYLITWSGDHVTNEEYEIFIEVYDEDGDQAPSVDDQVISTMGGAGTTFGGFTPKIALNPAGEFLVVWRGADAVGNEFEIHGQLLTAAGAQTGSDDLRISFMGTAGSTAFGAFNPSAAFSTSSGYYLVVWEADDNTAPLVDDEFEIYGQLMTSTLGFQGSRFRISETNADGMSTYDASNPDVAYDSYLNQFMISWVSDDVTNDENEISTQAMTGAGVLVEDDLTISDAGPAGNALYDAGLPAIAYNSTDKAFVVVWNMDETTDEEYEVWGQLVAETSPEPTQQPTSPLFGSITTTSYSVSWSAPASPPNGYLVLRNTLSSTTDAPSDQTAYSVGNSVGSSSSTVMYVGSGLTFNESLLTPGTAYYYKVFSYNGIKYSLNYRTTSPLTGNRTTYSLEPTAHAASFTATQNSTSQIDLTFSAASTITNADRYIILRRSDASNPTATGINDGAAAPSTPVAGTTLVTTITSTATTTFPNSGLAAGTRYNYAIIPFGYNGLSDESSNFRTAATIPTSTAFTLSLEPTAHAASFTATQISSTQINLSFSAASTLTNAAGYIILRRTDANPTGTGIADGAAAPSTPTAGTTLLTTISSTSTTSFSDSPISSATQYYYALIPFGYNGANVQTYNFRTAATIPTANAITLSDQPSAHPASFTAVSAGTDQINLSFSAASTITNAAGYIILRRTDGSNPDATGIVDGAAAPGTPTTGTTLLTTITSTATTTYNDTGLTPGGHYNYAIIPFGYNGTNAATYNFRTLATIKTADNYTLMLEPTAHAATFTATPSGTGQVNLTFSAFNTITNATAYSILRRADGANPTGAGLDDGAVPAPPAGTTEITVITNPSQTTYNDTGGIVAGTQYNYALVPVAYGGNPATTNFKTDGTIPVANAATLSLEPTAHPGSLSASAAGTGQINLLFSPANTITNAAGYIILRRQGGGSPTGAGIIDGAAAPGTPAAGTTLVTTIVSTVTTSYNDTSPPNAGTEYTYAVIPFGYNGSNPQTFNYYTAATILTVGGYTLSPEPSAHAASFVATRDATNGTTEIDLTFSPASTIANATGYIILRREDGDNPTDAGVVDGTYVQGTPAVGTTFLMTIQSNSETSFSDTGLTPGKQYNYALIAFAVAGAFYQTNNFLTSPTIPVANATTLSLEPSQHAASITAVNAGSNQINLTFPSASLITNAAGYVILRREGPDDPTPSGLVDGNSPASIPTATVVTTVTLATSYNDATVSPGLQYRYALIPYSYNGSNPASLNYRTAATIPVGGAFTWSQEPGANASTFTSASVSTTPVGVTIPQIDLTFTPASSIANASGYLVLRRSGATPPTAAGIIDGASAPPTPTAGTTLITTINSTSITSFSDLTVVLGTKYSYALIAYGYNGSNAETYNFNTAAIPVSTATTHSQQPANHPAFFVASSAGSDRVNLTFSNLSSITDAAGYIVLRRNDFNNPTAAGITDGDAVTTTPVAGTTLVTTITNTSATSFEDAGLSSGAQYNYAIIPFGFNGTDAQSYNYLTTPTIQTGNATTVLVEPAFQPTVLTFNSVTTNSMAGSFTAAAGTPAGYLVVRKAGSSPTHAPVDGQSYAVGQDIDPSPGESEIVVAVGNTPTFSSTGLAPETVYHYDVFAFNGTNNTYNYLATSPLEGSHTTLASEPTGIASEPVFSAHTTNSFGLTFTAAPGPSTGYLVVRRAGSAPTGVPTDGFAYSPGTPLSDGTIVSVGSALNVPQSGLTPGTIYFYKVFSFNGSGLSLNYLTSATLDGSTITICAAPTLNPATAIQQTSMSLSWPAVSGAASYALEISSNDFVSFFGSYSPKTIPADADPVVENISGLSPGTTYKFKLRAVNAAGESSEGLGQAITVPSAPVPSVTQPVTSQTAFTVLWPAVTGAEEYYLDVSTSANFPDFVTGYESRKITSTTHSVTGLSAGVKYFLRLRSANPSGSSESSQLVTQATLPATPLPFSVSSDDITPNSFKAKWPAANGATLYELEVGKDNISNLIDGYKPLVVENALEAPVTGLTQNTVYKFRLRSKSEVGYSPYSLEISAQTKSVPIPDFKINTLPAQRPFPVGSSSMEVIVNVTGGTKPYTVIMQSRATLAKDFVATPMTLKSGDDYAVTVQESSLDELGLEYFFEATDATGTQAVPPTDHWFLYKQFTSTNEPTIPNLSAGDKVENYRIISIPYKLDDNQMATVFDELSDRVYDTDWRLIHYEPSTGKNVDLTQFSRIVQGNGYWFISKEAVNLKVGPGSVPLSFQTTSSSFKMNLSKGWNQIGDPYPFNIDWQDVLDANPGKLVGQLNVFSENGTLVPDDKLTMWSGGFVLADNDIVDLTFPVTLKNTSSRKSGGANNINTCKLDEPEWKLNIDLELGSAWNKVAIGMHPEASDGKDRFDNVSVPRFFKYLEMATYHPEFFAPFFAGDIVPTQNSHSWRFVFNSNLEAQKATLRWDPQGFGNNDAQLMMLDERAQVLINLRTASSYVFDATEDRVFRIFYASSMAEFDPGVTHLARPSPNPSTGHTTIPVLVEEESNVAVDIFDLNGRRARMLLNSTLPAGLHELTWMADDDSGQKVAPGMYLIQMRSGNSFKQTQKIIIR